MSSSRDALRGKLLSIFHEEASGHIRSIEGQMAALGREPDGSPAALAAVNDLFRTVHTLKGAARSLSATGIERLCHDIEDLCSELVRGRAPLDGEARLALRALTERLASVTAERLTAIVPGGPEAPPAGAVRAPAPAAPQAEPRTPERGGPGFVRLEARRIERLGMMAEDLLAPRLASQARVEEARRLLAEIGAARREQRAPDGLDGEPATGRPADRGLQGLEHAAGRLAAAMSEDSRTLRTVVDSLIVELRQARMMPLAELLAVFPAMVEDLAREMGKAIRWRASGGDLLIDRQIAERIKDPLIHAVRNAIDHGIEPAEARRRAGKPGEGAITLTVTPAEGGLVAIELADDGAGIDPAAVRDAAVRSRLVTAPEAAAMADEAVTALVFQSSLSTRGAIGTVSGRGLGLAIVRETAERLGGAAEIRSTPGAGTVLRLEVPAALANFRGVAVRAGSATMILPRDAVERTMALPAAACSAAAARGVLAIDGEPVPFGDLDDVLGLAAAEADPDRLRSCLVLRHGARRGVVMVDEVIGDSEVVVKEFRPPLLRVRHVLAAGLLGTGQLALILRIGDVLDGIAGRAGRTAAPSRPKARHGKVRLLVVDDSITTRAMEVGLLEAAGYEVQSAADGLEAWTSLQGSDFDAVVSDVDMPNMDGFELTERIRADARLRQLPIVLVTALERREDHDRGLRLGANAYMMKSAFDQSMLIDLVRRVI